jgi:TMEM175 potassium channel family protein
MKTNRLEAFSDGVIAILITIMVLELKAPHDPTPASLARMWPTFFAYVLSFIIIAIYWVNHHHLIHLLTRVDSVVLWANINLLFWLSLIPWVTIYLGDNHALPFPVALYAAVSAAGAISFFLLRAAIARDHHEPEFKRLNKKMARKNLTAILIYIAAMAVAFIYTPLALVLIATPAVMYFLPERGIGKFIGGVTARERA